VAGFSNPIVGGGGALVYPSIHSPNFNIAAPASSPSPSWAILKNGLAYFFGLILAGGTITGPDYVINTAGAFFYSGPPAFGNLIVSIAGAAGTDAEGNPYPQGVNVAAGVISGTAISASTISAATITGTAITGSTFTGIDFIISAAGAFFYSGPPALGNLIASISTTAATTTDSFTNQVLGGFTAYEASGGAVASLVAQLANGALNLGPPANSFSPFPNQGLSSVGAGEQLWSSGGTAGGDTAAQIEVLSSNASGFAGGQVLVTAGQISTEAGSGPFCDTGWHTITLPGSGGFSGTIRVKLMPWNAVFIDIAVRWTTVTAAQTYTTGNLPSTLYYPTVAHTFAMGVGDTPTSDLVCTLTVPTSGGLGIFVPLSSGSGTANYYGGSWMYPTN
jgi:hypothetical protein